MIGVSSDTQIGGALLPTCPRCQSDAVIKNGHIHNGKPKFACKACGRQFVQDPQQTPIAPETRTLVDRLLLERVALAGIVRVTGVSARWLQSYVNRKYADQPRQVDVPIKKTAPDHSMRRSMVLCGDQGQQAVDLARPGCRNPPACWLLRWRANEAGAYGLWRSLPAAYRQWAVCYTDFWAAYAAILPSKRHKPVAKDSGRTSLIERFNNTLRQRCSRLVRQTLSFSKKLANHIGAIWYFIHDYNADRLRRLTTTSA